MQDVEVKILEKPELKNTVLIEGLPGIGLVGKLAADHMLDKLKAKKFAEIYSPFLPPQVSIKEDGTVQLVNNEMYYWKGEKNDIILLLGDFQGITPDSQYKLSEKAIDVGIEYGLKRIFTLGGLGTGDIVRSPKVFGAAGLLVGLGMLREIPSACLMGETHGQIIDAKSAEAVLKVLTSILGIEMDMTELAGKARDTEEQMTKMSKMLTDQKKAMERQQEFLDETPSYIR